MSARPFVLTPDLLLRAYRLGLFPMAESRTSRSLHWLDPEARGILPLHAFHLPRSLMKTLRAEKFHVTADANFPATIAACAAARAGRPETWINAEIERLFVELHRLGFAHSVEVWQDGRLVGGLYGACLGAAFFGESMFSTATDASKIALVARFGTREIPRADYHVILAEAVEASAYFPATPDQATLTAEIAAIYAESRTRDGDF